TDTVLGGAGADTVLAQGTQADDAISLVEAAGALTVAINGTPTTYAAGSDYDRILIETFDGRDTILLAPGSATPIAIEAGPPEGADSIRVDVTTGEDFFQVAPGATSDSGNIYVSMLDGAYVSTAINFTGVDYIAFQQLGLHGSSGDGGDDYLSTVGTEGDDAITLEMLGGDLGATRVNDGPRIGFRDLGATSSLSIFGHGGDDTLAANHAGAPGGSEIQNVSFEGGSPAASDAFVLQGSDQPDALTYTPLGAHGGILAITTNALTTTYTLTAAESVTVDGGGSAGGVDTLTVNGTTENDLIVHAPGEDTESGRVQVNSLLALDYQKLGPAGEVRVDGDAGFDVLQYVGTPTDDTFEVTSAAGVGSIALQRSILFGYAAQVEVQSQGVEYLELNGLDGDDMFTVSTPLPYTGVFVEGGGPGASDRLQILGGAAAQEFHATPDGMHGNGTVMVDAMGVTYVGVEQVDLFGNMAGGDNLTIHSDGGDDTWTVKKGDLLSGVEVVIDGNSPINYDDFLNVTLENGPVGPTGYDHFIIDAIELPLGQTGGGVFTVLGSGGDVLTINGTGGADTITVDTAPGPQGTVTVADGLYTSPVEFGGLGQLNILSQEGSDTINVSPVAGVPIYVDGGPPVGLLPGDTLDVTPVPMVPAEFYAGPENDSGGFFIPGFGDVSFD
ncbi:hypothetical protein HQ576_10700, partial [bacterium]|nr:hypothetical protein [bacterium]